jgi:hypothetical protein
MKILHFVIWFAPFLVIGIGFATSMIRSQRFIRLGVYVLVLFSAFLLDLQATSFYYDKLDIMFSQVTLLVLADFFWRGVRLKFKLIRFGALAAGIAFFAWTYSGWILNGPGMIHLKWEKKDIAFHAGNNGKYYIKDEKMGEKGYRFSRGK